MIQKTIEIQNEAGLHARAAAKLVQLCESYKSETRIYRGRMVANAKSIMGVMMLAAERGIQLKVVIRGPDASAAMKAVERLFRNKFGEGK